jgi:putative ABC transport system permease protein
MSAAPSVHVQRQVVLPLSMAVEIAYKSIRLRLSRSLLVTSGIVLALAFLTSILVTDRLTSGMRQWAVDFPRSAEFRRLSVERNAIQRTDLGPASAAVRRLAADAKPLPEDAPRFDAERAFGKPLGEWVRDLGVPLPAPESDVLAALAARPDQGDVLRRWIEAAGRLRDVRDRLVAPRHLQEMMSNAGVPSTPKEIAGSRTQTRWLLALALLVAFVGILNAMLMSVTERFREIGTMKCLGALDGFIIKLFLIESLFQGGVGTTVGVTAGVGLSAVGMTTRYGGYAWRNAPWGNLCICLLACVATGVGLTVAGALYPAWQAARMQPIEAMRVEA